MARIAVDFGTSNTVIARWNPEQGKARSLEVPAISKPVRYRLRADADVKTVHLIPSLIHYGESETLVGQQVVDQGLIDHRHTVRWIKRSIALGAGKHKRTPQGPKTPSEAGRELLAILLTYLLDEVSVTDDEFTFTAPVEAFEDFQDWLQRFAEEVGIQRFRRLDEATACILGYEQAIRKNDRFVVFDFGCGTLDVSAVRIDPETTNERKAIQLGQAGYDVGGLDVDVALSEDFCRRHGLTDAQQRQLGPTLLIAAEEVKIRLSRPEVESAEFSMAVDTDGKSAHHRTLYGRRCENCRDGKTKSSEDRSRGCLGCLLLGREFLRPVRETVDRALENAAMKAGLRRSEITRVVATGGTSLMPMVRRYLSDTFPQKVSFESPFDAVVRGACQGLVVPLLSHDYAIESFSSATREYEFKSLLAAGTEYPTARNAVRFWARGSYDGMTRIGIKIFEVSRMQRRSLHRALVDATGALETTSRVATNFDYICLNLHNPTFIVADPAIRVDRDATRFPCAFWVDEQRRLRVSVRDELAGRIVLDDHPVVRL